MSTKQYLIFALAVIMVLGCLVVTIDSVSVDGTDSGDDSNPKDDVFEGVCGTGGASWKYENGKLTITATAASNKVAAGFDSDGDTWTAWSTSSTGGPSPKEVFGDSIIELTISGNADISAGAFKDFKITSVTLSDNCTSVSSGAFQDCKSLTSVKLNKVATIGSNAFKDCVALTTVSGGASLTSIGSSAFEGCTKLASIDINKADVDHSTFKGCTSLKEIKATSSSHYTVHSSGVLLSDGGKTVFMCPTGLKPTSPVILDSKITKICLDYADVTYFVDICRADGSNVIFETVSSGTDVKARAVAYSSLGMEKATPSISGTNFVLTYELFDGWDILERNLTLSSGSATIDTTKKTISFPVSSGKGYTLLPMGVQVILTDSISNVTKIQDWDVDDVRFIPKDAESEILKGVESFSGNVVGYDGGSTAVLGETLSYHGVTFNVASISPEPGSMSEIVNLTIDGNPVLSEGTFANYTGLETVDMENVQKIPNEAFRYCTGLTVVNLGSCSELGEYAFEGCKGLNEVMLASEKVQIGEGAFNNCGSLEYIGVSMDTVVSGEPGVLLIHVSNTDAGTLTIYDGTLVVVASGMASIDFSTTKDGTAQKVNFYRGGYASVDIEGYDEVYLEYNAGTPNADCLVIFDSGLNVNVDDQVVESGSKLDSVPIPSKDGYSFKGWFDENGKVLTEDTVFSSSAVYKAVWQKENQGDGVSTYILALFAIAILGTIVVLAVNRFR